MNWIIRLIFDHLVAPGIRSKRSTLLGLLAYGLPLALAYLHSGEQLLAHLMATTRMLLDGADNPGTLEVSSGLVQIGLINGLLKAWLTHDAAKIEASLYDNASKADILQRLKVVLIFALVSLSTGCAAVLPMPVWHWGQDHSMTATPLLPPPAADDEWGQLDAQYYHAGCYAPSAAAH